ncbi:MAG TPA: hypothetical protein VGX25_21760 [Actinophytocola sp.]|uniref:sunset domain-containing protein n=1 Tax=Actinophytocola sp. TaxID=1872138 RepID=UPI002DDD0A88|nr:hypothetical protein [Actinophytocola sp.]HEV2782025.1 hypothetical protein [Actinophytocola sp.]
MPIFGQVWLWSLLAFLLGALLCWVLLVLPVRRRIDALESRLSAMRADAKVGAATERARSAEPPSSPRGMVPGFDDTGSQDEIRADMLTRAYAAQDIPSTPYRPDEATERGALNLSASGTLAEPTKAPAPRTDPTQYIGAHSAPLVEPAGETPSGPGRDWFDEPGAQQQRRGDHHLIDDDDADERGTIFTQRTTPIPAEVIRQIDEAGKAAADDSLVDDLGDDPAAPPSEPAPPASSPPPPPAAEPAAPPESTVDQLPKRRPQHSVDPETRQFERHRQRVEPPAAVTLDAILAGNRSDVDTPPPTPEPEPERAPDPEPVAKRDDPISLVTKANNRHTIEPKVLHGASTEPELTPSALPKRIPSKPQHRTPFGVQTVSPAGAHAAQTGERIRSLFEPMVPAESEQPAVPPPPHRLRAATATATATRPSAPGPFGPGSAMPLPGGASPSPEFTVKASVTALRYCTPDSPQFGRTVAEVWFRSAADAERVGFRPVGN